MQNQDSKFKTLFFALLFCAFSFWPLFSTGSACAVSKGSKSATEIAAEVNSVSVAVTGEPTAQIDGICSAIYKGDFAAARKLLGGSTESKSTAITRLADVISEYEAIEERRELARQAAYQKQLAKLQEYAGASDSNVSEGISGDQNEPQGDAGLPKSPDPNDIPKVLSVIAKVADFADEQQKQQLLSDSFVKQIIQKAQTEAGQYESKGKWLDAYIECYWWLLAIEPANEGY